MHHDPRVATCSTCATTLPQTQKFCACGGKRGAFAMSAVQMKHELDEERDKYLRHQDLTRHPLKETMTVYRGGGAGMSSYFVEPVETPIIDPCIHTHAFQESSSRGVEDGDTRGHSTIAPANLMAGAYGAGSPAEDPGGFGTGCQYFLGQRF